MANEIIELQISVECYNEIANALTAHGRKVDLDQSIKLTKNEKIKNPLDWRLIQVRKDCVEIAVKINSQCTIEIASQIYNYILKGEK